MLVWPLVGDSLWLLHVPVLQHGGPAVIGTVPGGDHHLANSCPVNTPVWRLDALIHSEIALVWVGPDDKHAAGRGIRVREASKLHHEVGSRLDEVVNCSVVETLREVEYHIENVDSLSGE